MWLLILLILCGCIENSNKEDDINNKFDLISYSIVTYEEYYTTSNNTQVIDENGSIANMTITGIHFREIGEGFIHQNNSKFYEITGFIKNNIGRECHIKIHILFYDENGIYLGIANESLTEVPANKEYPFKISIFRQPYEDIFDNIDTIEFTIE